jgi:hypothetical protein
MTDESPPVPDLSEAMTRSTPQARAGALVIGRAECVAFRDEVAYVRGVAYETSADDPIALAQAAFMISSGAGAP